MWACKDGSRGTIRVDRSNAPATRDTAKGDALSVLFNRTTNAQKIRTHYSQTGSSAWRATTLALDDRIQPVPVAQKSLNAKRIHRCCAISVGRDLS
jgi:hypothetical protein